MKMSKFYIILLTFLLVGQLMFAGFALASSTDGTIDSIYRYAWGEDIGWLNFGASQGNVHVTDFRLSGYALSETVGWLYLGDISNDGEGNLSGYAWGENVGWLKFNPTNGGVVINSSGEFTGSALGENIGWIIFDCSTSACVKTDWRPQSARVCTSWTYSDWSSCSNGQQTRTIISSSPAGCTGGNPVLSQSCSSGGSALPPGAYSPPALPSGGFSVLIKNGEEYTNSRTVILKLNGGPDAKKMSISNTGDFTDAIQEDYLTKKEWDICSKLGGLIKSPDCSEGAKTVYAKFYTRYGQPSQVVSDSIIYKKEPSPSEVVQPSPVAVEVSPVFSNDLEPGMSNDDAKRLQELLASVPALYPEGLITGFYGPLTEAAVRRFQLKYNVIPNADAPGNGRTGTKTRGKLQEVFGGEAPASTAAQLSPSAVVQPSPAAAEVSFVFNNDLEPGMSNDDVKRLQELLASVPVLYPEGLITGFYGSLTEAAVRRFQLKYNVIPNADAPGNGRTGPKTRAKLQDVFGNT